MPAAQVVIKGSMDDRFWATSARDVARWLPDIVQSPVSRNAKVNLVGQNVSWREAVAAFEQAAGGHLLPHLGHMPPMFTCVIFTSCSGFCNPCRASEWLSGAPSVCCMVHAPASKG